MMLTKVKVADCIVYLFAILFAVVLVSKFVLISISAVFMIILLLVPKTRLIGLFFVCSWFIISSVCILLVVRTGMSLSGFCSYLWFSVGWKTQLMINSLCIMLTCLAINFNL